MQFTCILRASKSQMLENGFKDAVFDSIYRLLLETLTNEAHSIAFPDFIVPFVMQVGFIFVFMSYALNIFNIYL